MNTEHHRAEPLPAAAAQTVMFSDSDHHEQTDDTEGERAESWAHIAARGHMAKWLAGQIDACGCESERVTYRCELDRVSTLLDASLSWHVKRFGNLTPTELAVWNRQ